jgi:hypothetical protein
VDGVEVTGGTGVADQGVAGDGDVPAEDLLTDLEVGE